MFFFFFQISFDFFLSSAHCLVKSKPNSTIEQQKCKGHEKLERHLISKLEFDYQASQQNKSLPNDDPVFCNCVSFIEERSNINCL